MFVANLDSGLPLLGYSVSKRVSVWVLPKWEFPKSRHDQAQATATGTGLNDVPDIARLLAVPDRTGLVMQERCTEEHSARIWPLPESK